MTHSHLRRIAPENDMKRTQHDRLAALLKRGTTSMEMIRVAGTVSPHSRLAEMKARGWVITRRQVAGKTYGRYFGVPPQ